MNVNETVLGAIRDCLGRDFVALYLVGSHDTSEAVSGSDIDYILVTDRELVGTELDALWKVRDSLRSGLDPEIDILPRSLQQLVKRGLGLKREGRLIGGRDIRELIQVPPKDERDEWLLSVAIHFATQVHGTGRIDATSLDYPDASDLYYGYANYQAPKPFVQLMSLSFLATAWLSKCHDVVVTDKHKIPSLYDVHIGSESLPFLRGLFQTVRGELGYQLPMDQVLKERTRSICAGALAFERQMLRKLQND